VFFLCVDKPAGYTSHDIVSLFRVLTGIKRIGHTGTLDPFATGVLLLAFQDATKLIGHIPTYTKQYQCCLKLGVKTETADCTGEVVERQPIPTAVLNRVEECLMDFTGDITQKPPMYSAIKVNGKRLYEYARQRIPVDIPSRQVSIPRLNLLSEIDG
jgi:tRNA pseudouridine55 synthase